MKHFKATDENYEFVPAADIIAEAEANRPAFGHSPLGFLSRSDGFLPHTPPLEALPASHQVWDEAAAQLPALMAGRHVRAAIDDLPLLSGGEDDLDDVYLWRATLVLSYIAHAYGHSAVEPAPLPHSLVKPWGEVNRRLGRPHPGITLSDYCYNWTLRDPQGPRAVENMDLMVSWCGNEEERIFLLSTTEMHSQSGPLVDASANLQTAIRQQDRDRAKTELLRIQDYLRAITFKSLLKIDPNPYSETAVDPLIWSKAFANFTAPVIEHERGLVSSGTSVIQLLDALFERNVYNTEIAHETLKQGEWLPNYSRRFVTSIRQVSLSDFVAGSGDQELAGIYNTVLDAYVGKRGFLGVHRLKVYGFMELGFKVGRTQTNSGFSGPTEARAWEQLDDALEATRRERYANKTPGSLSVKREMVAPATADPKSPIHQVVLDIAGQGLHYIAGDRLGIFPQNSPELIQKTLQALQAQGDEPIRLTSVWREALQVIIHDAPKTIPLKTFLAYAKIRPLIRPVGKALLSLSRSKRLYALLEQRQEDQVELWDAFEIVAAENYDVKRFWKAAPWEAESIARLVPPEHFRVYSISSAPKRAAGEHGPKDLHLTVGRLTFNSQPTDDRQATARHGTASGYLVQPQTPSAPIPVQNFRPSRFHLPDDPARPIVMFAGGTGISPFRGFVQQRAVEANGGPNWLFLGVRTLADVPYQAELKDWVGRGDLNLRVAFSREAQRLTFDRGDFVLLPGQKGYVDQLLDDEADAPTLWQYLQSQQDGGLGGYFYVCGQANFAHTVIEGLKRVIARSLPASTPDNDEAVNHFFRQMVAQGRLMLDVFTTFAPSAAASVHGFTRFDASELINHNSHQQGYWTVIQGNVYDMTEFMYLHPGGERLLIATAGLDSTRSYEKAEHHLNSEVHALLDLYKIGAIRRLDFKDQWGIAVKPKSLIGTTATVKNGDRDAGAVFYLSLHDFYRHWIRFVYKVVEVENSLNNNYSMRHRPITRQDGLGHMSKLKAHLLLEAHSIFYSGSWGDILGPTLELLWNITLGFCSHETSIAKLPREIAMIRTSAQAKQAERFVADTVDTLPRLAPTPDEDPAGWAEFDRALQKIEQCDRAFIAEIKATLRDGLLAFEQFEDRVAERGGDQLVQALAHIPTVIERYYAEMVEPTPLKEVAL
ncbi:MAG: hypothetical protein KDJ97_16780 [Anaerolineae bacterium]|nr:hypothetical protein [Anaerolineae bacterium]